VLGLGCVKNSDGDQLAGPGIEVVFFNLSVFVHVETGEESGDFSGKEVHFFFNLVEAKSK